MEFYNYNSNRTFLSNRKSLLAVMSSIRTIIIIFRKKYLFFVNRSIKCLSSLLYISCLNTKKGNALLQIKFLSTSLTFLKFAKNKSRHQSTTAIHPYPYNFTITTIAPRNYDNSLLQTNQLRQRNHTELLLMFAVFNSKHLFKNGL